MDNLRVIISGGGTGGHIFPAISIANEIKELRPDTEFLFVGAEGKMEMEKVPAAGYKIVGLPVAGLQRNLSLSNLMLPYKVLKSLRKAKSIITEFAPHLVIGVGGYASAPLLWMATKMGIPSLIQEQNSYAGLTNKILGKRVQKICVAYNNMDKFFPAEKIIVTGNPIRKEIKNIENVDKNLAIEKFGLDPAKKTVLIVGGSLGCNTLNEVMKKWVLENRSDADYQIIWQSGQFSKESIAKFMEENNCPNVINLPFIYDMNLALRVADIVVSRAGASTISELCVAGKATIFVPSPNVTEDHQTHNAQALVNKNAALLTPDNQAKEQLIDSIENLLSNPQKLDSLERNIKLLAKPDAGINIANEALKLVKQ